MTDGRLAATLAAIGRVRQWRPTTYRRAWLFAWYGAPLGYIVAFWIIAAIRGWHVPWPVFAVIFPALLVGQGLGWSYDVRRHQSARQVSTEN